jgi:hypothetical protein
MISKLTRMFIVTLLFAAASLTASSQDKPLVIDPAVVARGEALANEDPLALELRTQLAQGTLRGSPRRGFDIGMAIAEGHTLPGPGKDKICASLPEGDQEGCRYGVLFSVDRNRNKALASVGAAIAQANAAVASARNLTTDVFYKLGFDIATGIFGDPARGAQGNTATGPGSLGIRDSLSRAGQRGFNASVSFHLGRTEGQPTGSRPRRPPTPAVASNEIRCRGYSRPGGSEYVFFTINSRPSPTGETIVNYEIAFTPGMQAAGPRGEGLRPGECAWVDRPIGDAGPLRIRFETVANAQLKQQLHGSAVDRSPTAAESYPDVKTIPIYLKGDNRYWSFGGVTNAGSYFQATGHGYWKPPARDPSPTEPARRRGDLFPKP